MVNSIHLGFEVGTGKPVKIPLRHMVVTGQTQEAGKTTTLEALICRANLPAIAFVTKRGERAFSDARRIPPYFRERADWQFVASVLEAAMREKMRFERAWIMRASKGAKTLADVQRNVRKAMEKARGMSADIYLTLDAYLDIVVPRVASIRFAETLELGPGLNVLDLSHRDRFPVELQSLVMRSALEWVYERCEGTITVIPEAWEFCPQGRGSPVKLAAAELIRKGAGLKNYVWLDSQDIGGVEKELLRSCPVWLLGVQREANEIKRVLSSIPAGIRKPKASDVALLEKGQFFACHGRQVIKTYVQPAWASEEEAQNIATGALDLGAIAPPAPKPPEENEPMSNGVEDKLDRLIGLLESHLSSAPVAPSYAPPGSVPATNGAAPLDEDALYQRFKERLTGEAPAILKVLSIKPKIVVDEIVETIETDSKTLRGRLALMILDGFFDSRTTGNAAFEHLKRTGFKIAKPGVYRECDNLTTKGFLTKTGEGYEVVAAMRSNISRA